MDLEAQENPLLGDWRDEGRPSRIASYCKDAQRQGGTTCLWICFKEHGRMRAKDIQFKENETSFQFRDILKSCGWWRRFAIYSIVDVGEVQIHFYRLTEDKQIFVFASPVQHQLLLKQKEEEIESWHKEIKDPDACGISVNGEIHGKYDQCPNTIRDEHLEDCCPSKEINRLRHEQDRIRNALELLRLYFAEKSLSMRVAELRDSGFLYLYENLETEIFYNATAPYGRSIKAIHLVMGWSWQYITALVAVGIVVSICAAVLTSLFTHNLDIGWSAGSYTAAIVSILLSLFAALSRLV